MSAINEVGNKYGRLFVLEKTESQQGKAAFICVCDCGVKKSVTGDSLRQGNTVSCGCQRMSNFKNINEKRMESGFICKHMAAYSSWRHMIARCHNRESSIFFRYGEKGIFVCEAWREFKNFLNDMGDPLDGMTIDRIDNSKGYEPSNCRWADKPSQSRNRATTKLTFQDAENIRLLIKQGVSINKLSLTFGVSKSTISAIKNKKIWIKESFIQNKNETYKTKLRMAA